MADKVIYLREKPASPVDERNFKIKYAELLNPAQLEAVTHREGPLLVVAGAGSGKTRTLIYRVARLIESGVPPGAILLLTFTRRASQEMLRRAEQLVGDRTRAVAGGTFHSFANNVLRRMRHRWDSSLTSRFSIAPTWKTSSICCAAGWDWLARAAVPKKGTLAEAISMARNKRRALEEEIEIDFPHLSEHETEISSWRKIRAYKRERGLLDYDDLLYQLVELLEQYENVRRRFGELSLHHDR